MAETGPSSPKPVAPSTEATILPEQVTSEARVFGILLAAAGLVLGIAAAITGAIFTAPAAGPCYPASGGSNIPCPASPFTVNNMFVVLTLEILSMAFLVLGIIVLFMVWFRAHPVESPTTSAAAP